MGGRGFRPLKNNSGRLQIVIRKEPCSAAIGPWKYLNLVGTSPLGLKFFEATDVWYILLELPLSDLDWCLSLT